MNILPPFAEINEWTHTHDGETFTDGVYMGAIITTIVILSLLKTGVLVI